jgi:hypothetical protein
MWISLARSIRDSGKTAFVQKQCATLLCSRGKALHLNADLYERLESLWLRHGIVEYIIGQYENDQRNLMIEWLYY